MRSRSQRIVGLAVAVALGYFFLLQARSSWISYWLRTDAQQGTARITEDYWGGHGRVVYRYDVNQKHYTGISGTNWKDPRYDNVRPGHDAIVYYSASHPWLSLLYVPDTVVEGLPVLIIAFLIELVAIVTIIRPGSGWAFDLNEKKRAKNAT
jgi:hypothetical protein